MPLRPCIDCGRPSPGSRCDDHARTVEYRRTRTKRVRRPYTWAEQRRRARVIAAWRTEHGDWCPGWRRPGHASVDLTADHDLPVAAGGAEDGPLVVLCRSCNSRKGGR